MKKMYKNKNIIYLGHIINSNINMNEIEKEDFLIEKKYYSNNYIFIGRKAYLKSAINLCNAAIKYNNNNKNKIEISIIGLKEEDTNISLPNIHYYGYLNKDIKEQNEKYLDIIKNAKAVVNITEEWCGLSSICECMYYYTPSILNSNENVTELLDLPTNYQWFCKKNDEEELYYKINELQKLGKDEYKNLCIESHNKVKNFTYENFCKEVINLIKI